MLQWLMPMVCTVRGRRGTGGRRGEGKNKKIKKMTNVAKRT